MASAEEQRPNSVDTRDVDGRTLLHHCAARGDDEVLESMLNAGHDPAPLDKAGATPLHSAAHNGHAMAAYLLASKAPASCRVTDAAGQTPADLAADAKHGEVLNAMLLACAGCASSDGVASLEHVMARGAVPDTWAPDGSSALMLAASADSAEGVDALLAGGAAVELADALGRTALMFAAGRGAPCALIALLRAGASIATRDRRERSVMAYAAEGSATHQLLSSHLAELEKVANERQAALLAVLEADEARPASGSGKGKGKKKGKRAKAVTSDAAAQPSGGSSGNSSPPLADGEGAGSALGAAGQTAACQHGGPAPDERSCVPEQQLGPQMRPHDRVGSPARGIMPPQRTAASASGNERQNGSAGRFNCDTGLADGEPDTAGWVQVAKGGPRRASAGGDAQRPAAAVGRPTSAAAAEAAPRKRTGSFASLSSCDTDSSMGSARTQFGAVTLGKSSAQRPLYNGVAPQAGARTMREASPPRAAPSAGAAASGPAPEASAAAQQPPVSWASKVAGRPASCAGRSAAASPVPAVRSTPSPVQQRACDPVQSNGNCSSCQSPAPGAQAPSQAVGAPFLSVSGYAPAQPIGSRSETAADASPGEASALAAARLQLARQAAEIASLRGEVIKLQASQRSHQAEVDMLLRDAAAHEANAVAAAVAGERAACAQVFGAYMRCPPAVAAALADAVRRSVGGDAADSPRMLPSQPIDVSAFSKMHSANGAATGYRAQHGRQLSDSSALETAGALQRLQLGGRRDSGTLPGSYKVADHPLVLTDEDGATAALEVAQLCDEQLSTSPGTIPQQLELGQVSSQPGSARAARPLGAVAGVGCGIFGASAVWGTPGPSWAGKL